MEKLGETLASIDAAGIEVVIEGLTMNDAGHSEESALRAHCGRTVSALRAHCERTASGYAWMFRVERTRVDQLEIHFCFLVPA